jgi:hypothetical protein
MAAKMIQRGETAQLCVRNQATVGVYIRGDEHGVLGSIYKEREEER